MRLTVFNGSPRTSEGNTAILLADIVSGFTEGEGNSVDVHYLNTESRRQEAAEAFAGSEIVLLSFPLYHHAMPGIVMTWLEMLEPLDPDRRVKMGFLVQGGLPEARQSRFVEAFLERLPARLGCDYLGTIIRGGVEAMQFAPDIIFIRMHRAFVDLGRELAAGEQLGPATIAGLAGRETLSWWRIGFFRTMKSLGIADKYWNNLMKENRCWEERFGRPYAPAAEDRDCRT